MKIDAGKHPLAPFIKVYDEDGIEFRAVTSVDTTTRVAQYIVFADYGNLADEKPEMLRDSNGEPTRRSATYSKLKIMKGMLDHPICGPMARQAGITEEWTHPSKEVR